MEAVAGLLVTAVVVLLIFLVSASAKQKRSAVLTRIAGALGGVPSAQTSTATGNRHGVALTYRFADRGAGSSHEPWTEIDVDIPERYPLTIRIERGQPSAAAIRAGEVIDIEIGHPGFDQQFLVEAAPSDVIKQLLDAEARAFLMTQGKVELATVDRDGKRYLRLAIAGWEEDPDKAVRLADAVARIGSRIREAYAAADATIEAVDVGSPYRPAIDQQPANEAQAAREREIANVEAVRKARVDKRRATAQVVVIVFVFGLLFLIMLAAGTR